MCINNFGPIICLFFFFGYRQQVTQYVDMGRNLVETMLMLSPEDRDLLSSQNTLVSAPSSLYQMSGYSMTVALKQ